MDVRVFFSACLLESSSFFHKTFRKGLFFKNSHNNICLAADFLAFRKLQNTVEKWKRRQWILTMFVPKKAKQGRILNTKSAFQLGPFPPFSLEEYTNVEMAEVLCNMGVDKAYIKYDVGSFCQYFCLFTY